MAVSRTCSESRRRLFSRTINKEERLLSQSQDTPDTRVDYGGFVRPCVGERFSGDVLVTARNNHQLLLAVVDVLGHGDEAHELAVVIKDFLEKNWSSDVISLMQDLHADIKGSRGAVAGIGVLELASGELQYTSVGNTTIRLFGSRTLRLPSVEGIIGGEMRSPKRHCLQLRDRDVLIQQTDGVKESFDLSDYPQLLYEGAATVARSIVHRFGKLYDDASCLVLRYLP